MANRGQYVFLITVDSLRYDHLNATFAHPVTPFLESVSPESLLFSKTFATGSGTSTSFPGIMASSLPLDYGYDGLGSEHTPLAAVLSKNDVRTIGVTASTVTSQVYNYNRGFNVFREPAYETPGIKQQLFDLFRDVPVVHQLGKAGLDAKDAVVDVVRGDTITDETVISPPYTRADELTDIAIDAVTEDYRNHPDSDRFVWLHYMDPHRPYFPPEDTLKKYYHGDWSADKLNTRIKQWESERPPVTSRSEDQYFNAETMEAIRRFYRAEVRFVDDEISRLADSLDDTGILEDSLFLICADHGDEFYDHGDYGHRPKMYNELLHVPLIAYDPSGQILHDTGKTNSLCSLLDVPATVASLFDVERPTQWRGQPLLEEGAVPNREYVFSELCHTDGLGGEIQLSKAIFAVQDQQWKYIQNRQQETELVFNLERDPAETEDVSKHHPQVVTRFQRIVTDRLESVTDNVVGDRDVSDDVYDRLEELGYY